MTTYALLTKKQWGIVILIQILSLLNYDGGDLAGLVGQIAGAYLWVVIVVIIYRQVKQYTS